MAVGSSFFAVFEVETPPWRKLTKWLVVAGGTVGLHALVGHWALAFPAGLGPDGVFVAMAVAFSTLAVVSAALFRRGRWARAEV